MIINREKLEKLGACKEAIVFFSSKYDQIEEVALLRDVVQYKEEVCNKHGADIYEWCYWLIAYTLGPIDRVRFSVYAAELVLHIYEEQYPGDMRPRNAIDSVKAWILDPSPEDRQAIKTARNAARNAAVYYATVYYAAYAAYAADTAAWAADTAYAAAKAAEDATDPSIRDKILEFGIELLEREIWK